MTATGAMPHDRIAERITLASGMHSAAWHHDTRHIVDPSDYWFPQHQAICRALDELHDIGPYPYGTWEQWETLHPQTPPLSLTVRLAAIWTLVDNIPMWVLRRIAETADGTHIAAARTIRQRAEERAEIAAIVERFHDLTGAS